MPVLRQFGSYVTILAVLHWSLGAALAIRAASNNTTSTEPDFSKGFLDCSSSLILPILQFVITNYIAHAFTIRFSPGYGKYYTLIFSLKALIFPCFGLLTACRTVELLAVTEDDPLTRALEAGALCTVARTKKWKPEKDDEVWLPENS